jgi:large subunit ribosomal protein L31
MKKGIHPKYYPDAKVTCSCGNTFTVGSTKETIRTDICSACHPFFTGEQRLVDTAGQVERFIRRLEKSEDIRAEELTRLETEGTEEKAEEEAPIEVLDLSSRVYDCLDQAGIATVEKALEKLAEGDEEMLDIKGFGPKSLAELKEKLQAEGFVPVEEEAAESAE